MSQLDVEIIGSLESKLGVPFKNIPKGIVFFGSVGYETGVFLRVLYGVIKLGGNTCTWTSDNLSVENYRPVNFAKLTVG